MIGSLKSNVGHSEAVSGLSSVIKAVLALEHRAIPPSIEYERRNPKIKNEWNVEVVSRMVPWPTGSPRRISINSFGYGGCVSCFTV